MKFTYKAYRSMLSNIQNNGYIFTDYHNMDLYEKAVILRHDVDFSPQKALKIAEIEHAMGVKSTYFVLLSTNFYNICSKEINDIFSKIVKYGHAIGLHFDEKRYSYDTIEELKEKIYFEVDMLSRILNIRVKSVSMHRPSEFILKNELILSGIENTYCNKYFKEIKYVSDSRMYWRENPISLVQSNLYKKIQILTHPFWYDSTHLDAKQKLQKFLEDSKEVRFNDIKSNFTNVEEYLKGN